MEPNHDNRQRRVNLTDRTLKGLKAANPGTRYEVLDAMQPALAVRVTSNGAVTFVLRSRFPGSPHFTRKALGSYPKLGLADAREKARAWLRLIGEGKDPQREAAAEADRGRQAELLKKKHTFAYVAERYIAEATPLQRQGRRVARDIRNVLIPRWGETPIVDIDREDVAALLTEKRNIPATASNLLIYTRCLFAWAIETQEFGLQNAPTDHVKQAKLIGERNSRERTLTDAELTAFWRACRRLEYPEREAYQLLALTGLRLNEAVQASWPEIDLDKRNWTIPAARMKGTNKKAREHLVPLTDALVKIIEKVPTFHHGEFLFTTTNGRKPIVLGSKAKHSLDVLMLEELQKAAALRGDDPAKVKLAHWTNHDLRRTCRTMLSALKIPTRVAEAVLSHAQPGVAGTYDRHDYREEKLEALQKWGDYVHELVEPKLTLSSNILPLRRQE
jgi:integrase